MVAASKPFQKNKFSGVQNFFPAAFLFLFATFDNIVHEMDVSLVIDTMSMVFVSVP